MIGLEVAFANQSMMDGAADILYALWVNNFNTIIYCKNNFYCYQFPSKNILSLSLFVSAITIIAFNFFPML